MKPGLMAAAALLLTTGAAAAQEASAFVGATLTSNYVSDGITQTDDKPAFQPYLEVEVSPGFYVGSWLSNVDFGTEDNIEIDLYAGFRRQLGPVYLDASYYRYYYDDSGYCCDEIIAAIDYPVYGPLSGASEYSSTMDGAYSLSQAFAVALPADFEVSAGYSWFSDDGGEAWDAGVTKSFTETLSGDLRYYDASYADPTFVVSLDWATDWASLFGGD